MTTYSTEVMPTNKSTNGDVDKHPHTTFSNFANSLFLSIQVNTGSVQSLTSPNTPSPSGTPSSNQDTTTCSAYYNTFKMNMKPYTTPLSLPHGANNYNLAHSKPRNKTTSMTVESISAYSLTKHSETNNSEPLPTISSTSAIISHSV
jgi:hypothetical protein